MENPTIMEVMEKRFMTYRVCAVKVESWCRLYRGEKFHAMIADPPYHLTIEERFGTENAAPARKSVYSRSAAGFMGKQWDGGDIAFLSDTWAALGQHLHPGAFMMVFASSRGWHRLAVAIEDAGFIIHPSIFGWVFLSGFPKATNISKGARRKRGLIPVWRGEAISDDAMLNIP